PTGAKALGTAPASCSAFALSARPSHMPLTQGAALGWLLLPRWGVWVNCDIIPNIIRDKKTLKKHDKFMSTFPTNLEKKYVKKNYFHPFPPSLLVGSFVICGF
ncbi:MAG: hypothetical protein IKQ03_06870, partial [Prevotella sp.]|nr:hypothetical protein [Prevotella sp.]